jgi:hypothetical protein
VVRWRGAISGKNNCAALLRDAVPSVGIYSHLDDQLLEKIMLKQQLHYTYHEHENDLKGFE